MGSLERRIPTAAWPSRTPGPVSSPPSRARPDVTGWLTTSQWSIRVKERADRVFARLAAVWDSWRPEMLVVAELDAGHAARDGRSATTAPRRPRRPTTGGTGTPRYIEARQGRSTADEADRGSSGHTTWPPLKDVAVVPVQIAAEGELVSSPGQASPGSAVRHRVTGAPSRQPRPPPTRRGPARHAALVDLPHADGVLDVVATASLNAAVAGRPARPPRRPRPDRSPRRAAPVARAVRTRSPRSRARIASGERDDPSSAAEVSRSLRGITRTV